MAKRKRRLEESRRVFPPLPSPSETQPRSIDTGQQMRDALRVARADQARRFVEASLAARLARLETEDLRRNRYERKELVHPRYLREDGKAALVEQRLRERQTGLQGERLPPLLRAEFRDPQETLVCVRRRARRSVLFALRKVGKGSGRKRKARWSDHSYIVCRRVR
nr:MAG TPA: hypothetical protein [Microviridae sp.]